MSAPRQRIAFEDVGEVTVVTFADKEIMDSVAIERTSEDLNRLVDELGRRRLLLNFSGVAIMATFMLGKLNDLKKRLEAVGGKLVLCAIAKRPFEAFTVTGLDRLHTIAKDEQAGLASF